MFIVYVVSVKFILQDTRYRLYFKNLMASKVGQSQTGSEQNNQIHEVADTCKLGQTNWSYIQLKLYFGVNNPIAKTVTCFVSFCELRN